MSAGVGRSSDGNVASSTLGREDEVAALEEFLDAVPDGPIAFCLEGEAGIGKTALWKDVLSIAAGRGWRVLSSRPTTAETSLAFAGLGDLLSDALDEALPALPPPQARALEIALLRVEAEGTPADRRALSLGVLSVVRSLAAAGPIVLAVDDVWLLDRPTRAVLEFVIRRLDREALGVLVATRRPLDEDDPLNLRRNLAEDRVRRLRVGPIAVEHVAELLRTRLNASLSHSTIDRLHERSGGNPLFALEMGRALLRLGARLLPGEPLPVPVSLRDLVRDRLTSLPTRVSRALLITSALSQPTVAIVGAALGSTMGASVSLDEAIDGGVIELEDERLRFTHPLLGSVIYSDAPLDRRRRLHRRLAELVRDPEERAKHLALATDGPDAEVASALDEAARRARDRGAPDAAAELSDLARRLTPPEDVADQNRRGMECARYRFEAGDTGRARQLLEEVVGFLPPGRDRAVALRLLGTIRWYDNREEAGRLFEEAFQEAGDEPAIRLAIERDVAWMHLLAGDAPAAEQHARSALLLAEQLDDPVMLAEALTAVGFLRGVRGDPEGLAVLERAAHIEERAEVPGLFRHPVLLLGILLKWADRFDDARTRFGDRHRHAVERGDESSLPFVLYHLSELECWAGDWALAERYANESFELSVRTGQAPIRAASLYAKALVDSRIGLLDEARVEAEEGLALAREAGDAVRTMQNLHVLGFIDLCLADHRNAGEHLREVDQMSETMGMRDPGAIRFRADEIESLIGQGKLDDARAVLEWLEERSRALGRAWGLAVAARSRGLMDAAAGDLTSALEAMDLALQHHESVPDPFELGRTLLAKGATQRRVKQKAAARATLGRSLEIFERLGSPLWSDRVRAELARIGGRAPAPLDLTPTEERVAELVSAGHTNQETAELLFMSVRTVEVNLTRIYRKLGIRSRTELAARLAGDRSDHQP
jgi:DNA-binding CsgD family transcriptional regulator